MKILTVAALLLTAVPAKVPTPVIDDVPPSRVPLPPVRTVESTAYCLTGTMANGDTAHSGAVAMNGVKMGTRYKILTGPERGEEVVVADRIGHSSDFDIAMPGDCDGAREYGRRSIDVMKLLGGS